MAEMPIRLELDLLMETPDGRQTGKLQHLSYIRSDVVADMLHSAKVETAKLLELEELPMRTHVVIEEKDPHDMEVVCCVGDYERQDDKSTHRYYEFTEFGVEKSFYKKASDYGVTWRCWNREPNDSQSSDIPWKAGT